MTSIAHCHSHDHNDNVRLEQPAPTQPQAQTRPRPLLVKELAGALGVSLRFVYQMRACGFPMHGNTRLTQMATVEEARAWIKANNFRLSKSVGVIDPNGARLKQNRNLAAQVDARCRQGAATQARNGQNAAQNAQYIRPI